MKKQNETKGNKVTASLYVGVGGFGGKMIKKVCRLAKDDDLSHARFVILDTDVNDLRRGEEEHKIVGIQTSSPRSVRDYLLQDDDAREEWFPNNMIINSKTVSEGAGQVRSISRLALNATIRTNEIRKLYKAIDALYNKDGEDKKQTVKVAIASTVAGGTGSGIAMIVGMLIRNYIAENYPDSSAIIRGFFIMPDVLNTLKPSDNEALGLRRNGYATIKEINAFMMRPFFEAVPELRRYLDLSVEVPNASGGIDKLSCSPFDFCFLFDQTDSNVSNMEKIEQYLDYVAHCIYELFIGPMSAKASSKEDNIHKEFLDDKKLSRNRFGGAGASVVRYPYESIRDYVAYEWMEKQLIGFTSDQVSEADAKQIIYSGWLMYDKKYFEAAEDYKKDPTGKQEPDRGEIYVTGVDTGTDNLSNRLREKFLEPKNKKNEQAARVVAKQVQQSDDMNDREQPVRQDVSAPAVEAYIQAVCKRAHDLYINPFYTIYDSFDRTRRNAATKINLLSRYNNINEARDIIRTELIKKTATGLVDSLFNGNAKMTNDIPEPYMFEAFLSLDGKALHPNAMRYMLYKLQDRLQALTKSEPSEEAFDERITTIILGKKMESNASDDAPRDTSGFQVLGGGKETNLFEMCKNCKSRGTSDNVNSCNKQLSTYANAIETFYRSLIRYYVCVEMKSYVDRLIEKFNGFYGTFEKKVKGLAKKKQGIMTAIAFKNGDCEYNLFNNPVLLRKLADDQKMPQSGGQYEWDLFAGIYNGLKFNLQKARTIANNVFSDEKEQDVFDEIMIEQFKNMVDECGDLDMDIVRACGREHKIAYECKADETPNETLKEEYKDTANKAAEKNAHLIEIIEKGYRLAAPSIIRRDFEEARKVDAMAFNMFMEDGEGMVMDTNYFAPENASDTVSKYELRFYRSVYNVMPIQLQKLSPPQQDPGKINAYVDSLEDATPGMVGAYFTAYQEYMQKIGPDNRLNPVITPHIDKRWNSITRLPDLDPQGYQRIIMKNIHKAMIYGFIFQLIEKRMTSQYDENKLVYEYIDGRNGLKSFIVSNHTKCDRLFEVLDALYFDRYAVHSIHETVRKKRKKEFEESTQYEETTFARYLPKIDRMTLIGQKDRCDAAKKQLAQKQVSLFEIPLLYWDSLPRKDASEIDIMMDAIFEIFEKEVGTFVSRDDFTPLVAKNIVEQYNLLYENFCACSVAFIGKRKSSPQEVFANDAAIKLIRTKVLEKISDLDVSRSDEFRLADWTEKDELTTS